MPHLDEARRILGLRPVVPLPKDELSPTVTTLASLMDDAFRIPGTNLRIGLDGLIGLIPGIGDLAGLLVAGVFLSEARRIGASRWTRARMIGNYALDFLVGIVPVLGDAADFAFKANRRNYRLLQAHLEKTRGKVAPRGRD